MHVDRRSAIRAPCDLAAEWRRRPRSLTARVRDLTCDGLFLGLPAVVPLGQIMDLVVALPTGPVELLGVSRFCGRTRMGRGIGIAIHAIAPDHRARWDAHYQVALEEMLRRMPDPVQRILRRR